MSLREPRTSLDVALNAINNLTNSELQTIVIAALELRKDRAIAARPERSADDNEKLELSLATLKSNLFGV